MSTNPPITVHLSRLELCDTIMAVKAIECELLAEISSKGANDIEKAKLSKQLSKWEKLESTLEKQLPARI